MSPPPFIAGQEAFRDAKPLTDNPHDPDAKVAPEDWPGAYANWRDGWKYAYRNMMHTKKQKRNAA